jgi:hypothetical protein
MAPAPSLLRWSPLMVVVAMLAACGGDPPTICGEGTGQLILYTRDDDTIQPCFEDPEGEELTISSRSSDPEVVSALTLGDLVRVKAVSPGRATVTVTAEDPGGQTAQVDVEVLVPNQAPIARGRLSGVQMLVDGERSIRITNNLFTEPDDQYLVYSAQSADESVVIANVVDSLKLHLSGIALGTTTVTLIATDPGGLTAEHTMEAAVLEPILLVSNDFNDGSRGDWAPNFATVATLKDGKLFLEARYATSFGWAQITDLNAVEWEFKAAMGRENEGVHPGVYSYNPPGSVPFVWFFNIGLNDDIYGAIDANYRLTECCWQINIYGNSDAIKDDVNELNEVTALNRNGKLTISVGTTGLVQMNVAATGWPTQMRHAVLASWNTAGAYKKGWFDWVEIWGLNGSDAAWYGGPPDDMPDGLSVPDLFKAGAHIPSVEIPK